MTGYVTSYINPASVCAGFMVFNPGTVIHICLLAVYTARYILLILQVKPHEWNLNVIGATTNGTPEQRRNRKYAPTESASPLIGISLANVKKYDFGEWMMYSHIDQILTKKDERSLAETTIILGTLAAFITGFLVYAEFSGLADKYIQYVATIISTII